MGTDYQPDSVVDDTLIEVKRETDAVSTIRSALLKLAYAVTDQGQTTRGILLVIDPKITDDRLDEEEKYAKKVLDPGITKRLGIVVYQDGELRGCPEGMTIEVRRELGRLAGAELAKKVMKIHSGAAFYEIFKILVHQWLLDKGPMTAVWLANTAGLHLPHSGNCVAAPRQYDQATLRPSYRVGALPARGMGSIGCCVEPSPVHRPLCRPFRPTKVS